MSEPKIMMIDELSLGLLMTGGKEEHHEQAV